MLSIGGEGRLQKYLVEDVLHRHEEALSLVESELVVFVVATRQHTGHVSDECTAVVATSAVTHRHIVRRQWHFHRTTTDHANNNKLPQYW